MTPLEKPQPRQLGEIDVTTPAGVEDAWASLTCMGDWEGHNGVWTNFPEHSPRPNKEKKQLNPYVTDVDIACNALANFEPRRKTT